jgi:uncharacterized protein
MVIISLRAFFVLFLVAGVPVLSFTTARPSRIRSIPRPALYISAVFSQGLLAALGIVVAWVTVPSFSAVGIRAISPRIFLGWTSLLTLACLAAIAMMAVLERLGWWPQESEISFLLLPATRREKMLAVLLVAPSAGFCEEFLYRGYLLPQLSHYFSSQAGGWMASSIAFGLAHSYQGISGMLQAGMLGALLACPMVRLGSVYPSMAAHFIVDGLLLAWLGRKLLYPSSEPPEPTAVLSEPQVAPGTTRESEEGDGRIT